MASAAKAETGGLCINTPEAVPERITAENIEPKQPLTTLEADTITADGIKDKTVEQKQSEEMDMRFYWLQD